MDTDLTMEDLADKDSAHTDLSDPSDCNTNRSNYQSNYRSNFHRKSIELVYMISNKNARLLAYTDQVCLMCEDKKDMGRDSL